jgi:hypothetical protein
VPVSDAHAAPRGFGLDLFGTEGFSALHRVSVCCARAGIGWAVVPGEAVFRVLPDRQRIRLAASASTVEAAMATLQDQPHRPPQPGSDIAPTASRCVDDEPCRPTHDALVHAPGMGRAA